MAANPAAMEAPAAPASQPMQTQPAKQRSPSSPAGKNPPTFPRTPSPQPDSPAAHRAPRRSRQPVAPKQHRRVKPRRLKAKIKAKTKTRINTDANPCRAGAPPAAVDLVVDPWRPLSTLCHSNRSRATQGGGACCSLSPGHAEASAISGGAAVGRCDN